MFSRLIKYDARLKRRILIVSGVCTCVLLVYFFGFYFIENSLIQSVPFQVTLIVFLMVSAVILTYVLFYYEELARSRKNLIEKLNITIEKKKDSEQKKIHELASELEKAKKMEALGLITGGAAHDLNNILSGMVSIPQMLLLDLPQDSPLRKPIELIMDSGKRASKIVEELLTIGRGTALTVIPVRLNDIVMKTLSSPESHLLKKYHAHVKLKTDLFPDLPCINGSRVHLQKAVLNLIANAAEATKSAGDVLIKTQIVTFNGKHMSGYENIIDGTYVQLSVIDTGEGIPKDALDHIFEPFYTKKKLGRSGTGLGLYIVWNTVHDHKGYISVDTGSNQTIFNLYFPVSDTEKQQSVVSDHAVEDYTGHGEHILVVDDIQIQRQIATIMLTRIGYRVSALSSGEEAIEFIKNQKVDLVILDMIMEPKMNGLDTFLALRQIDPKIKALITSGYFITSDVKAAQLQGAGSFIKKPYSIEQVGCAIKKELNPGSVS